MEPIDVTEAIFDRVDDEGVATVLADDGTRILIFSSEMLRRLLEDAEKSGKGQVMLYIRQPAEGQS